MEVKATLKYVKLSASKARDLARMIQGLPVADALYITENSERKAAFQLGKTLKSAIANAENNAGLSAENLFVKEAVVDQGPTQRRWWYGARGMAKPILRKSSHVRVVLSDEKPAKRKQ